MSENQEQNKRDRNKIPQSNNVYWLYVIVLVLLISGAYLLSKNPVNIESVSDFKNDANAGYVKKILVWTGGAGNGQVDVFLHNKNESGGRIKDVPAPPVGVPHYYFIKSSEEELEGILKDASEKGYAIGRENKPRQDYGQYLGFLIPIGILVLLWFFFIRRMGGGGAGGQIFNIGKSKASLYDKENEVNVTFNDVAGLEEAKEEVQEVVEFLKHPEKFTKLGGHIPKGVLLVGLPGTGKTLLAKAVAGEAKGFHFFP